MRDNLILICTDEQTIDTLAAYGNCLIDMPNLNALAEDSIVYKKCYCTQPVCTPSRGSFLSGLWPHQHGAWQNNLHIHKDVKTLGEYAKEAGYATGYVGKWHLGDEIFPQHGFDTWVSIEDEYIPWYSTGKNKQARCSYYHHLLDLGYTPGDEGIFTRDQCARLPEEHGKPAFVADQSIAFIDSHRSESFVLVSSFLEPHMPFFGPRDNQYNPDSIPLPSDFDAPRATRWTEALAASYFANGESGIDLKDENGFRRMRANYWGLCSLIDTHIGRLLNHLKQIGLYETSHIIFTSDHGEMAGSHRLVAKNVMYESSVRVPLLIKPAGETIARCIDSPVSQIDLLPTMLDLMRIDSPDVIEGKSLLKRETTENGFLDDIIIEWNEPEMQFIKKKIYDNQGKQNSYLKDIASAEELEQVFRAPRRALITSDGNYKLIISADGDNCLFDLFEDPFEKYNIASIRTDIFNNLSSRLLMIMDGYSDWTRETLEKSLRKKDFCSIT